MAIYDNTFKRLVHDFPEVCNTWILGREVKSAQAIETSFSSKSVTADSAFEVVLEDGEQLITHIEFQRRSTARPMKYRMLEYMLRFAESAEREEKRLVSTVIYMGKGAGGQDTGQFVVKGLAEEISLAWHYRVIRLWEIEAEELLAQGEPALLSLIPQTRMVAPEITMVEAIERIRFQVKDQGVCYQLLEVMMSLLETKEQVMFMNQMFKDDPFMEDFLKTSPWVEVIVERRSPEWYQQGVEKGIEKGIEQGLEKGIEQGIEQGIEILRRTILKGVVRLFKPEEQEREVFEKKLKETTDTTLLEKILDTTYEAETFEEIQALLSVG